TSGTVCEEAVLAANVMSNGAPKGSEGGGKLSSPDLLLSQIDSRLRTLVTIIDRIHQEVVVVRMAMGEVGRKNPAERGEGEKLFRVASTVFQLIDGSDAVTADSTASAEDPQITGKLNDLSENLSSLVLNYTAAVNSLRKELYELCAEDSRIAERTSTSINSDALRAAAAMVEEDRLTALRNYVSSLSNSSA
ncbi:hypothetical protein FOZ63_017040, partial [Perkinsus olseni]